MEIDGDEIELARWNKESAYQGHYPADYFETIWAR
jgi:hypothetical protein